MTRRQMIQTTVAMCAADRAMLASDGSQAVQHLPEAGKPAGWYQETIGKLRVFVRGTGKRTTGNGCRAVVLLHEITGMSPGCVDFGTVLATSGFRVYMPLLFGHPLQESLLLGGLESCVFGGFHCNALGADHSETPPVQRVQELVQALSSRDEVDSIAVIGMCLSGAFGIATMRSDSKVKAVIVSQPATPKSGQKQDDVGISKDSMKAAKKSKIPMLGLRFKCDPISTEKRMQFLHDYFGESQFEVKEFNTPDDFHETLTHKLHAVLTGQFGLERDSARAYAINFLNANLPL